MKLNKKILKMVMVLNAFIINLQFMYTNVYAGIGDAIFFTGTKALFNDLKTPLIGLSAVIGLVLIMYNLIKIKMADETDTKVYKKKIGIILGCCILVVCVASLLPTILSYYKAK